MMLHLECFPIFETDVTLDTLARWCLISIVHDGVLTPGVTEQELCFMRKSYRKEFLCSALPVLFQTHFSFSDLIVTTKRHTIKNTKKLYYIHQTHPQNYMFVCVPPGLLAFDFVFVCFSWLKMKSTTIFKKGQGEEKQKGEGNKQKKEKQIKTQSLKEKLVAYFTRGRQVQKGRRPRSQPIGGE